MKEALDMVAHKIGRVLNGDPTYVDSWHDMQGYPKLVEDELTNAAVVADLEPAQPAFFIPAEKAEAFKANLAAKNAAGPGEVVPVTAPHSLGAYLPVVQATERTRVVAPAPTAPATPAVLYVDPAGVASDALPEVPAVPPVSPLK